MSAWDQVCELLVPCVRNFQDKNQADLEANLIELKDYLDGAYKRPVNVYSRVRNESERRAPGMRSAVANVLKQTPAERQRTLEEQCKRVENRNENVQCVAKSAIRHVIASTYVPLSIEPPAR